jgi:hypothetical protein
MLGAATLLYRATGGRGYLDKAKVIALLAWPHSRYGLLA